jgi:predicted RND superfamily exporter protein
MTVKRAIRAVVRFVMRFYFLVIIAAAALSAAAYPRTARFFTDINTDLAELIPQDYETVKTIKKIREKFKSIKTMILIVEDEDPKKARTAVDELDKFLRKDPLVGDVESKKRGYNFFDKHKLLFIDLDDLVTIRDRIDRRIQREKLGGLYIDFEDEGEDEEFKFGDIESKYKSKYSVGATSEYFTNDLETTYSIYVYPEKEPEELPETDAFYRHIRKIVGEFQREHANPTTQIYFSGPIRTRVDEYNTVIKDLQRAGLISGIGIALILILYFRRIFAVGLLFLPLTIGIITTFAFSSLFIKNLNLVTSFLFAILGGLGVEIGIHMLARYIEERRPPFFVSAGSTGPGSGKNMEEALFSVLYHTGGSALTSAATVSATFLILVVNDFKGFSEFGFIAGTGLIINFLCYIFVFPSLLVAAEKIRLLSFRRSIGFEFSPQRTPAVASRFPLPRFVLAGLGVFALLTIINLPRVDFEWRFSKIKANIAEAQEAKHKQRKTSSSVNSPAMVIIKDRAEAEAIKNVLDKKMENPNTVINAFKSYYDLVPYDQKEKLAVIGEMKDLLADKTLKLVKGEHKKDLDRFKEALNETRLIEEGEVPPKVRELFWGQKGETQIAYINPLPDMEMDDGRNAIKFAEEIQEIKTPNGTFYPSSDALIFADVLRTMIADGKRVVFLAFLLVYIIVFLDFRKFSVAALIVSPIVLGVIFMFGFMYIFKIKLNFYNMVVAPTVVGTSIDNAVHVYHRYKEMGKGSLMAALKSSGGAALMSSMTNICGFLGLVFAAHNGLRSIGDLAVTGMAACLITTLVFFPALLQIIEDHSTTKTQRHQEKK